MERLKPSYSLSEAGQDARVSLLTGRPAAHKTTVGAMKTYRLQREYLFEPMVFTELQNAQAIVLAYDGLNPWPPTYCYLKPAVPRRADQLLRPCREGSPLMSFDLILPFLRPIAHLIQDPDVSEIMVNGTRRVFVERRGTVRRCPTCRSTSGTSRSRCENIARALGDDISEERPVLDARLPDGSRVAAVFPPCSLGGTTLTIRKFQTHFFTARGTRRIRHDARARARLPGRGDPPAEEHPHQRRHQHWEDHLLNALAAFMPSATAWS